MTSNVHSFHELKPRIIVMGVGGAGGNAVNNMIASGLHGVEFVAANTDAQALSMSGADVRLQLGANLTEGLGAGSNPEIGEGAAEEVLEEVKELMAGAHMVFIACGMGGGTGTGAAPVIARIAQELGVLTVAVVTKPFQFEGQRRMRIAEAGIEQLRNYVDTMIVIPNQNLFRLANEQTTFAESFCLADSVLNSGVACVTDLIMKEGLINLDFADVKTVITEMGAAVMGTGVAHGEGRARKAAEEAISNPLIDDISLAGAKGLLISISGGHDMTLFEVDEVASRIRQEVDPNANIIVGATFDEQLEGYLRVSLVASGLNHGHPQSMHIEADRRRMENDNREEENALGLNERIQQLEEPIGRPARFGGPMQQGGHNAPKGQGIVNQGVRGIPAANNMGDVYSSPPQNRHPGGVDMAGGNGKAPVSQSSAPQGEFGRRGAPKGQSKMDGAFSEQKGNVQIVKKPPRFMNDGAETSFSNTSFADGGSYDSGMDGRTTGREFVPGAPQKLNQPIQPTRRMPSMEDLPITGQKQLKAYEAPSNNHGIVAQKKKVGFFDRITGRNRSQDDEGSEEGGDSEPAPVADPLPDFVAGPPQRAATHPPHRPADVSSGGAAGRGVADERGAHAGHHMPPEETSYYGQRPPPAAPEVPVQRPERAETAPRHNPVVEHKQVADEERRAGAVMAGSVEKASAYDELLKRVDHSEQSEQTNDYVASEFEQHMQAHYNQHPQHQPQVQREEDAAPLNTRPETAQERYPTIEIKKGLGHPLSIDDDEDISDIPPFLKKKAKTNFFGLSSHSH